MGSPPLITNLFMWNDMHATERRGIMDTLSRVALHGQPVLPLFDRQLFTNVTNRMFLSDLS